MFVAEQKLRYLVNQKYLKYKKTSSVSNCRKNVDGTIDVGDKKLMEI